MRTHLILATLLTGCAGALSEMTPPSVQPIGPDTFQVVSAVDSRDFGGGIQSAQRKALAAANETCDRAGKKLMVKSVDSGSSGFQGVYAATFRCLSSGDPELTRPNLQPAPNVVVQNR